MNLTLKTAGAATVEVVVESVASNVVTSNMMNAGLGWGMSEDGEETNQLETLSYETENGTATLEDANANGVYYAVAIETENMPMENMTAAPVSENTHDQMSFSEAFASAREEVGPGGVFTWNGNAYSTYYKEEWEGMNNEEQENYWAQVNQAEQENEQLACVYEVEPIAPPENEIIATNTQEETLEAEPIEMDLDEDGIHESILVDLNEDGIHDAIVIDTNNDGQPDLILADTDHDGKIDSYMQDTNHDGEVDEAGTIPTEEEPYIADNEDFGSDYDNNTDVSDII